MDSYVCAKCGRFKPAPNKPYGYTGEICSCKEPQTPVYTKEPYNEWLVMEKLNKIIDLLEKLTLSK